MSSLDEQRSRSIQALNKLCKWRSILAGWQLGTRLMEDPESRAVRDHRDATLIQQTDMDALLALLTEKGTISEQDQQAIRDAASGDAGAGESTWPAVREHRETSLRLRAELNALTALLLDKGVVTEQEYLAKVELAAAQLDEDLERRFPGARTTDIGVRFYDMDRVMEWLSKFPQ